MTLRAAVFASGRGSNFQVLVNHAERRLMSGSTGAPDVATLGGPTDHTWRVSLLVTDRTDAPVLERAEAKRIPTAVIPTDSDLSEFAGRLLARLDAEKIDLVLLAGYLKLIPPEVVRRYEGRMLNLHPALLPMFGGQGMYGRRVYDAVLAAGVRVTGVTVHFVDAVYDQGPILAQWPVPVLSDDTPETLANRIHEVEHLLYPAAVDALVRGLGSSTTPIVLPLSGRHFHLSDKLDDLP